MALIPRIAQLAHQLRTELSVSPPRPPPPRTMQRSVMVQRTAGLRPDALRLPCKQPRGKPPERPNTELGSFFPHVPPIFRVVGRWWVSGKAVPYPHRCEFGRFTRGLYSGMEPEYGACTGLQCHHTLQRATFTALVAAYPRS